MQWFKRLFERRAMGAELFEVFASGPTAAGIAITPELAQAHPTVFGCLQVLSQDVGRTPIKFRERVGDSYEDAETHDLYEILGSLPNPEQTATQFKSYMQWQLLTFGRAFAEIVRVDGRVVALWPLQSEHMRVDRDAQRRKRWTYQAGGQTHTWTFDPSHPPIFELTTETPIKRCRELIGTAAALNVYLAKFFANGGRPSGVLQAAGAITPDAAGRLAEAWRSGFGGSGNAFKVAVLEGGLEFKPIASANDEAQLVELLGALNIAICGAFRVPPWKIGDLSKATYSNMAAGELAYVTSTLDPYFQLWEDAIRRDLLSARQYRRFSVLFDRGALIRSDVQAQHTALATGIQAGIYSQNDARRALGLNPIPDGDRYMVNSALIPAAQAGKGGGDV
jgi:HK97 family phage portal protein